MDSATAATQQVIAAWVQAVGALLAIAVAIWISRRQTKQAAEDDTQRTIRRRTEMLEIVLAMTADMASTIRRLPNWMDQDTLAVEDMDEFEVERAGFIRSIERLGDVPLFELGSAHVAFAIGDIERIGTEMATRLRSVRRMQFPSDSFSYTDFKGLADKIDSARKDIKDVLDEFRKHIPH